MVGVDKWAREEDGRRAANLAAQLDIRARTLSLRFLNLDCQMSFMQFFRLSPSTLPRTIFGKVNETYWQPLHSIEDFEFADRSQPVAFRLQNVPQAFSTYKIEITGVADSKKANSVQLADLELIGMPLPKAPQPGVFYELFSRQVIQSKLEIFFNAVMSCCVLMLCCVGQLPTFLFFSQSARSFTGPRFVPVAVRRKRALKGPRDLCRLLTARSSASFTSSGKKCLGTPRKHTSGSRCQNQQQSGVTISAPPMILKIAIRQTGMRGRNWMELTVKRPVPRSMH